MLCHQPCVQGEKEKLGKVGEKASAEELQGPSLHSAPGYFYAFYFPSNELFTFSAFQAPQLFVPVLVSLVTLGKSCWRALKCVYKYQFV